MGSVSPFEIEPSMYDAIIFDVDGTLWNASQGSAEGWNTGLAKLDCDRKVTSMDIERVAGRPFEECVEVLLPRLKQQHADLLSFLDAAEIEAVKQAGGTFYDGVIEGIGQLARSRKVFLVSNCQGWYMRVFLEFAGIESVLAGYDCHGMSGESKASMLTKLQLDHSFVRPVYVGDTGGDEVAAHEAGMDFIQVSYGFGTVSADAMTFNSFPALLEFLEAQSRG
jgi:phosphoglycolate phosphatase